VLDIELGDAARRAFALANAKRLAVRAVVVTVDRLVEANAQLDLWEATERRYDARPSVLASSRPSALQHALDRIRTRYGSRALGISSARPPAALSAAPR
jgi:hypothetical protein